MAVCEAWPRQNRGDAAGTEAALSALRARWRTASIAAGWRYPSDWALPEVDSVCASILLHDDLANPLADLGRARAQAGCDLDETLTDLAALHTVLGGPDDRGPEAPDPDELPTRLVRTTALAWAEASLGELRHAASTESLTGLTTAGYLRTRLAEVYRQAARDRRPPRERHVLLVVTLDLSLVAGWSRLMAMVLVADGLRGVFDGGETITVLGPSVAVVLADREAEFGERAMKASWMITDRLRVDPHLASARLLMMRMERLPDTVAAAWQLLCDVSRA